MEYDKRRILELQGRKFYLDHLEENDNTFCCNKCILSDLCDRIADDANKIEFQLCMTIEDKEYAHNTPNTYFKLIDE